MIVSPDISVRARGCPGNRTRGCGQDAAALRVYPPGSMRHGIAGGGRNGSREALIARHCCAKCFSSQLSKVANAGDMVVSDWVRTVERPPSSTVIV